MALGGNMTQREQRLATVIVVAVLLTGAYLYFMHRPKAAEIDALALRVDSLETANEQAKKDYATGSVDKLRVQADEYQRRLKVMRRLVPTSNEVPALLEDISTAARRVGLDLAEVEPLPVLQGEQFDTYRYKMSVTGGYHAVGRFLSNVGSLSRIIAPVTLEMKPAVKNDKKQARAKKDESLIDTGFQVQTYVAHTALPDAIDEDR
ncbi:MAG: type 4a pilus biogenesis protein PilO [Gemmatimonadaceae bacterium]|nr:type 4a pilus biogenesis protein PilO [Gemmatimonadaceae bacterium]